MKRLLLLLLLGSSVLFAFYSSRTVTNKSGNVPTGTVNEGCTYDVLTPSTLTTLMMFIGNLNSLSSSSFRN